MVFRGELNRELLPCAWLTLQLLGYSVAIVTCAIIRCGNGLSHVPGPGLGSWDWTQHPEQSCSASLQLPLELFASCSLSTSNVALLLMA